MAWFIMVREIAGDRGEPTGTFRLTAKSDEDGGGPFGLCDHAHGTRAEAETCVIAIVASEAY